MTLNDEGKRRREVHALTEPMLTEGEIAAQYAVAAEHYNAMASACKRAGVPSTLHAALYDTHHGAKDIRAAINNLQEMARELADGLVNLLLVINTRVRELPASRGLPYAKVMTPSPEAVAVAQDDVPLQESSEKKSTWLAIIEKKFSVGTLVRIVDSDKDEYIGHYGKVWRYDLGTHGDHPLISVWFDNPPSGVTHDGFHEDELEVVPLRCPKCDGMPLADDNYAKVLCESCNDWFDVRTKERCDLPSLACSPKREE